MREASSIDETATDSLALRTKRTYAALLLAIMAADANGPLHPELAQSTFLA